MRRQETHDAHVWRSIMDPPERRDVANRQGNSSSLQYTLGGGGAGGRRASPFAPPDAAALERLAAAAAAPTDALSQPLSSSMASLLPDRAPAAARIGGAGPIPRPAFWNNEETMPARRVDPPADAWRDGAPPRDWLAFATAAGGVAHGRHTRAWDQVGAKGVVSGM